MRVAVASHPERPDLLRDFAVALRDDLRWAEILDLLSPLADRGGLTPALVCELARAAIACGRPELALRVLDGQGAEAAPEMRGQRVLALYALNRIDEARAAVAQVLAEDPDDEAVLDAFADDCLQRGAAEALVAVCRQGIDGGACSSKYLAYLSAALALADHRADVAALVDLERLCCRIEIASGQVDNEELVQAILTHPSIAPSPEVKPTRGRNLRLTGLASVEHPAISNLLAVIRPCIDAYLAERHDWPHPLFAHRPQAAWMQGWALVVSEDGYEETHIHPQGWLTAVYYARVPQGVSRTEDHGAPPPGSIIFEAWPPSIRDSLPDFPNRHLEPCEGTLLIFPSFLGHRTIPTGVGELRICAVLDIIPLFPAS
ncbi:MAG: 2OG-Fe(II) oxygenase family protein [Magnetospirillum sp.]|nr:2OG-Fe(II) oxygenase family protein [Magnetospirillum sp.]